MKARILSLFFCLVAVMAMAAAVSNNSTMPVWNNASDTFTAFKVDATNTASGANSLVLDLMVDSTSVASVDKDGDALITGTLGVTGISSLAATTATTIAATSTVTGVGIQDHSNEAITATVGGATTGLITQGIGFVTVTSSVATKQISLPAATVGDRIKIHVTANGCELISVTAADTVNNVTVGATNELALVANSFYEATYIGTNDWIVIGVDNVGVTETPLAPDAL